MSREKVEKRMVLLLIVILSVFYTNSIDVQAAGKNLSLQTMVEDDVLSEPMLVVLVEFDDVRLRYSERQWYQQYFGRQDSVRAYYDENSGGNYSLTPYAADSITCFEREVTVTYRQDGGYRSVTAYLTNTVASDGVVKVRFAMPFPEDTSSEAIYREVAMPALSAAAQIVDLSHADLDGNGVVQTVQRENSLERELHYASVIAGVNATYDTPLFSDPKIGSYSYSSLNGEQRDYATGVVRFGGQANVVAETIHKANGGYQMNSIGTLAHEFGHSLGLPDLYSVDEDTPVGDLFIGKYSLMAQGLLGPDGKNPAPLDPLSLLFLNEVDSWRKDFNGWCKVVELDAESLRKTHPTYLLSEAEETSLIRIVFRRGEQDEASVLLDNTGNLTGRHRSYQTSLTSGGIAVWCLNGRVEEVVRQRLAREPLTILSDAENPGYRLCTPGAWGTTSAYSPLFCWEGNYFTSETSPAIFSSFLHNSLSSDSINPLPALDDKTGLLISFLDEAGEKSARVKIEIVERSEQPVEIIGISGAENFVYTFPQILHIREGTALTIAPQAIPVLLASHADWACEKIGAALPGYRAEVLSLRPENCAFSIENAAITWPDLSAYPPGRYTIVGEIEKYGIFSSPFRVSVRVEIHANED